MLYRNFAFSILFIGGVAVAQSQNNMAQNKPRLEDGSPVKLRLQRTISSADAHVEEQIDFDVLEEVKIGSLVVIPKGSIAWGTVTAAQPKRRMARGGKLEINIDAVRLADGEKTALRAVRTVSGGGHTGAMTAAIVATSLIAWPAAPFFLFMHGKDITIPKGTEITAYVNGDKEINAVSFDPAHATSASAAAPPSTLPATSSGAPEPTNAPPAVSLVSTGVSNGALATVPQIDRPVSDGHIPPADPSTVVLKSDPDGAEVMVDGKFVGSTPSTVQLIIGEHSVSIQKPGFTTWHREITITAGGVVSVNANLEKAGISK